MHNKKLIKLVLAFSALFAFGAAHAQQSDSGTGTLAASATISPECAVAQSAPLSITKLTMLDTTNADQDTTTDDVGPGALYAICTSGTSTPMLRFQSANVSGTSFRLKGADGTTYITYTLWEGSSGSSGTSIAYNTDAAFTGFTADGTRKTLALSMEVPHANKVGKGIQLYSDTITVTSSYAP